jgi:hypothetical protein
VKESQLVHLNVGVNVWKVDERGITVKKNDAVGGAPMEWCSG